MFDYRDIGDQMYCIQNITTNRFDSASKRLPISTPSSRPRTFPAKRIAFHELADALSRR